MIQTICTNPKCKKVLEIADKWAGKKGKCPRCQTILIIPARRSGTAPKTPAASAGAKPASAEEIEALAAAALAEEEKAAAQEPAKPIEFQCPYCDAEIKADRELGGKQMPCPQCGKIIKVPMPVKEGPKDWRKVDRLAATAVLRDGVVAPEGSWGTATSASAVSQESLEEAEAIPVIEEPVSIGQRVSRGVGALALVVLGIMGLWIGKHLWNQGIQKRALAEVVPFAPEKGIAKLPALEAAELHRAVGEYYLRAGDAPTAHVHLMQAQARLLSAGSTPTARDLALIDLAQTQIGLGGDKPAIMNGAAIPWNEVSKELMRTASLVGTPEARLRMVHEAGRSLMERGQGSLAETVARTIPVTYEKDRPEMIAALGLELVRGGQAKPAQRMGESLWKPFEGAPAKGEKSARPKPGPRLMALMMALGNTSNVEQATGVTVDSAYKDPYPEIRLGYALGLAYQGKWADARRLAGSAGAAGPRLEALVGVADVAAEKNASEAGQAVQSAVEIADKLLDTEQGKLLSAWLLERLVRVGVETGQAERAGAIVGRIGDHDLHEQARLDLLRSRLASTQGPDMEAWQEIGHKAGGEGKAGEPYSPLMALALAEHNAQYSPNPSALLDTIQEWEPNTLQPFGFIGVALGDQASGR